ncbi:Hpt domain-containing protein [Oleidesulfovibrio alaskensis]|jgi:HPt (histidine-containing phosphotransfer) domain-containing protein|uniref:Hpt domain-containing protein n=1 Tax=Oleidesulfovibrio alaskensis TaxID=58180 RepID=UPI00041D5DE1|nr:Hpt domain-containing protein [Oleidesulfovibrio alaskensis]
MTDMLPVLDTESTLQRLGGDASLLQILYAAYLEDTPQKLLALAAAVSTGNFKEAGHVAHTLKGSSATVGAAAMSDKAREMELACQQGNLREAESARHALEQLFSAVRKAILETPA